MYEGIYEGPIIVNQIWAILTFSVVCISLALGFWGQSNGAWDNSKNNGMSEEDKNKFRTRMFILFVVFFILMFGGMYLFGFTYGDDSGPGSDFY